MLHATVDRLWWLWQKQAPQQRRFDFGGRDINDEIPGYGDLKISQMIDFRIPCVTYQEYSGDNVLTVDSIRAMRTSSAEDSVITSMEDVTSCLPPPLSDDWLIMNGLDPVVARRIEAELHNVVTRTTSSKTCANNTNDVNGTNKVPPTKVPVTSDADKDESNKAVTVTTSSSSSSIPDWGAALLAMGACIVVLMAVLVVMVLRSN
jgi:hypothetical protein